MGKPVTSVVFAQNAPVRLDSFHVKDMDLGDGTRVQYLNCTEVRDTAYGFLELVPQMLEGEPALVISVPPGYILWMVKSENPAKLGFV